MFYAVFEDISGQCNPSVVGAEFPAGSDDVPGLDPKGTWSVIPGTSTVTAFTVDSVYSYTSTVYRALYSDYIAFTKYAPLPSTPPSPSTSISSIKILKKYSS